jgi:Na+/proline symporter
MNPILLLAVVIIYFLGLLLVAHITGKGANEHSFFIGNKQSNWMLVAFGMIGTSLSGVTFVSVPGAVGTDSFSYFQITLGYFIGYLVVAYVLLPLYYRLNLTSIYNYLQTRFGLTSYKTGAVFFILSRTLGATARLYLVVNILQVAILDSLGVPFLLTTVVILLMILLYTYQGGVKTIIYTDTLQTSFMLIGLIVCVVYILRSLNISFSESLTHLQSHHLSNVFSFNLLSKGYFIKQIVAGAFITIAMTGLDQEMMQKNISVKTLKDAQKNMITMATILMAVILLFLYLGGLLQLFSVANNITASADKIFPTIALHYMPNFVSIIFIVALISALFPSADGAITALTSSICIDIIGIHQGKKYSDEKKKLIRKSVHLMMAFVFLILVFVFKLINSPSMIGVILKVAGYTYGPLLGLFSFGLLSHRQLREKLVPFICITSPVLCYLIDINQKNIFGNFEIGLELLVVNGLITFFGLWLVSRRNIIRENSI